MSVSKEFVLAGKATFTVEVPVEYRNGYSPHYTYRVRKVKSNYAGGSESWFVKLLTGPDNTSSYTYLGMLNPATGAVRMTAKSKMKPDSYPVRLLNRVLSRIWAEDHTAYEQHGFKTHHAGKCGRCGRKLTVPSSIESGIGPECARIMA